MKAFSASALVLVAAIAALAPAPVEARQSPKKAIWGPTKVKGKSQFPIYRDLGVGIYQTAIDWSGAAPTRPARPSDPTDPAYRWSGEIDFAVNQARRYGMRVAVLLNRAPPWANGGRTSEWAPRRPQDFADFAAAASRRYPGVHLWLIWGEPSKRSNFKPLASARSVRRPLTRRQKQGPRLYARILDASYASLKGISRRNVVIGGNTFTGGEVIPLNFIRALRLPGGRRPRMDLYGHNPFTARRPNLRTAPLEAGYADFSDLDTLGKWLDRNRLTKPGGARLRLFLSEFVLPTDHFNVEFGFYVTRRLQASWLADALRISRRYRRIYTFGWLGLYDDPPRADGMEVNRGLIDRRGRKKPAYLVYKRG